MIVPLVVIRNSEVGEDSESWRGLSIAYVGHG